MYHKQNFPNEFILRQVSPTAVADMQWPKSLFNQPENILIRRIDYSSNLKLNSPFLHLPVSKLRIESTTPIVKSTSPGILDITFFAHCCISFNRHDAWPPYYTELSGLLNSSQSRLAFCQVSIIQLKKELKQQSLHIHVHVPFMCYEISIRGYNIIISFGFIAVLGHSLTRREVNVIALISFSYRMP